MTKRKVRVEKGFYTVHAMDEFNRSLIETYKHLERDQAEGFADRWLDTVKAFVLGLESPKTLGEIDPQHFSDTFSHYQIRGTHTTLFFLVEGMDIYLITSGYSARDWPKVLKKAKPEIDRQLKKLKKQNNQ